MWFLTYFNFQHKIIVESQYVINIIILSVSSRFQRYNWSLHTISPATISPHSCAHSPPESELLASYHSLTMTTSVAMQVCWTSAWPCNGWLITSLHLEATLHRYSNTLAFFPISLNQAKQKFNCRILSGYILEKSPATTKNKRNHYAAASEIEIHNIRQCNKTLRLLTHNLVALYSIMITYLTGNVLNATV